jgi:Uma2 family endonuclease
MATVSDSTLQDAAQLVLPASMRAMPVPPLENGDRLSRAEFERRYDAMPNLKKAELINGIVYMGSPVRTIHGTPHALMAGWLSTYFAYTPGLEITDNTTVRLDDDNEPQPDLALFKKVGAGGQARIDEDKYVAGGPELAIEIAASNVSRAAHMKKDLYLQFRVQEYIVWRVDQKAIDWFVLHNGIYEALSADETGLISSLQFPGLVLDVPAMLRLDLATVLTRLQQAIGSPAHAEYVQRLKSATR